MTDTSDAMKSYEIMLPEALALPASEVLPYRYEPDLVIANVATGMKFFAAKKALIPTHLPEENIAHLESLSTLALAVKFAAMRAEQALSEKLLSEKQSQAYALRRIMLPVAKGLGAAGLVPEEEVRAIVRGKGARDAVEDCVSLAHLFRKHEANIAGKHAVTPEQIKEAAELGTWLMTHMRSAHAPAEKDKAKPSEVEIRNRLATLLTTRHERLEAVAFYFHGRRYAEFVPPLMSRVVKRKEGEEPKAGLAEEPELDETDEN